MVLGKKTCLALGALLAVAAGQAFAAPPSEQQVRKLMDVVGLGNSLSQMNVQVTSSMRQALPCVSAHYWDSFIDDNSKQEFIGRLVPVYQKHFTADEVDGLIKFYSSPLGQKVLTEMPQAMGEANQAGQQWSHEHGQQMIEKLEQAGTLGANGRCPATVAPAASAELVPAGASSAAVAAEDDDDQAAPVPLPVHTAVHAGTGHRHVPVKKHTPARKGSTKGTSTKSAASKGSASKAGAKPVATPKKAAAKKKAKPPSTSQSAPASGQGG